MTKKYSEYVRAINNALTRNALRNCFWDEGAQKIVTKFASYDWVLENFANIEAYNKAIYYIMNNQYSKYEELLATLHKNDEAKLSYERIAILDAVTSVLFDLDREDGKIKEQIRDLEMNPVFVLTHQSELGLYKDLRKQLHLSADLDSIIKLIESWTADSIPTIAVDGEKVLSTISEVSVGSLLLESQVSPKRDKNNETRYKSNFCSWYRRKTKDINGPVPLVLRDKLGNEYAKYYNKKYGTKFKSYFEIAHSRL